MQHKMCSFVLCFFIRMNYCNIIILKLCINFMVIFVMLHVTNVDCIPWVCICCKGFLY